MESSSGVPPKRREKSGGDYVKRPLNAFMVWSRVRRAKLREEMPDLRNTEISRRLGAEWREMSAEQKLPHIQRSRQLRIEHFDMYPNYRYRPKRKLKPGPVTGPRPVADILQASRSKAPPQAPPPPPSSLGLGYRSVTPAHTPPPGPPNACVSRVSGVPIPSALFCNFPYGYTRPSQQVFTSTACSSTRVCPTHNKPTMYPYAYSLHPRPYPHPYHRPLTLTLPSGSGTLHYIPTSLPEVDQDTVTSLPGSTRGRSTSVSMTTPTPQFLTSASYSATERPIITVPHYSLPPMTSLMHRSTNEASGSSPCVSAPSDPMLKCRPLQPLVSSDDSPSAQLLCTETDDDSDTETCSSPEEQGGSCHDNRRLQNLRSCTGLFWATPLAPGGGRAKEKVIVETVPAIEPVSIAGIEEPRGGQFRFEWN